MNFLSYMVNKSSYIFIIFFNLLLKISSTLLTDEPTLNFREVYLEPEDHSMYFQIDVKKYVHECFFHSLQSNDLLHVYASVLWGADLKIDVTVEDPNRKEIFSLKSTQYAWFEHHDNIIPGDYKVCLKNNYYSDKRVYLDITSYSRDKHADKKEKINQLNETHNTLEESFARVVNNVQQIRRSQVTQRIGYAADSYYVETNNEYVMKYSIVQLVVVILCGLIQTYFIKNLFKEPSVSPDKYKPKA